MDNNKGQFEIKDNLITINSPFLGYMFLRKQLTHVNVDVYQPGQGCYSRGILTGQYTPDSGQLARHTQHQNSALRMTYINIGYFSAPCAPPVTNPART